MNWNRKKIIAFQWTFRRPSKWTTPKMLTWKYTIITNRSMEYQSLIICPIKKVFFHFLSTITRISIKFKCVLRNFFSIFISVRLILYKTSTSWRFTQFALRWPNATNFILEGYFTFYLASIYQIDFLKNTNTFCVFWFQSCINMPLALAKKPRSSQLKKSSYTQGPSCEPLVRNFRIQYTKLIFIN